MFTRPCTFCWNYNILPCDIDAVTYQSNVSSKSFKIFLTIKQFNNLKVAESRL